MSEDDKKKQEEEKIEEIEGFEDFEDFEEITGLDDFEEFKAEKTEDISAEPSEGLDSFEPKSIEEDFAAEDLSEFEALIADEQINPTKKGENGFDFKKVASLVMTLVLAGGAYTYFTISGSNVSGTQRSDLPQAISVEETIYDLPMKAPAMPDEQTLSSPFDVFEGGAAKIDNASKSEALEDPLNKLEPEIFEKTEAVSETNIVEQVAPISAPQQGNEEKAENLPEPVVIAPVPQVVEQETAPMPITKPVAEKKEAKVRTVPASVPAPAAQKAASVKEKPAVKAAKKVKYHEANQPSQGLLPETAAKGKVSVTAATSAATSSSAKKAVSVKKQPADLVSAERALKLKRYDAALSMFVRLYNKNPRDARVVLGRAVALQNLGRNGEAVAAYKEVLSLDPDNNTALTNMLGLVAKKDPKKAAKQLGHAERVNPDSAGVKAQMAISLAQSGRMQEALVKISEALEIDKTNAMHAYNQAIILDKMGEAQRALLSYEKALELDAVYGSGGKLPRGPIYDRLSVLR